MMQAISFYLSQVSSLINPRSTPPSTFATTNYSTALMANLIQKLFSFQFRTKSSFISTSQDSQPTDFLIKCFVGSLREQQMRDKTTQKKFNGVLLVICSQKNKRTKYCYPSLVLKLHCTLNKHFKEFSEASLIWKYSTLNCQWIKLLLCTAL